MKTWLLGLIFAASISSAAIGSPPATVSRAILPQSAGGFYSVGVVSYRDLPFRTVVRQQYDFSCGSAAVATLLRYHYGRDVGESSIFKAMYVIGNQRNIRRHGFSLADIQNYLKTQGLRSDGYRMPLERYAQANVPAIVVVRVGQYKHFVVVKGIEGGRVLVGDSALGLKSYSIVDFKAMWDGLIFVIHDDGPTSGQHNFNNGREWAMLPRSDLPTILHDTPVTTTLSTLDATTLFQVLGPNVADSRGL